MTDWRPVSNEPFTVCVAWDRQINPDAPDAAAVEKLEDMPGFGQGHDAVWTPAGFAHADCRLPTGYRFRRAH